jgi:starch phosphorylase
MNDRFDELRHQYGCGPVQFSGADEALYNRHLLFDAVIDPFKATPREQYEAMARSLRDVISQRWLSTERTYELKNPKRVYYLSMEFLLGRSLMNNALNARLAELVLPMVKGKSNVDPALVETEPDAGLGNGGLGRLAACFLDSMATLALPGMGYGLRYEYGIFKQTIQDGWQFEQPDNWLRRADPWEVARLEEAIEVKLNCSFELRAGELQPIIGRPSILLGIPFDRPVIGYGGKTINTLRLWGAATPGLFRLPALQPRRLRRRTRRNVGLRVVDARSVPRRFHESGTGIALPAGIFPGGVLFGRSGAALPAQQHGLERAPRTTPPSSSTTRTPRWRSPS